MTANYWVLPGIRVTADEIATRAATAFALEADIRTRTRKWKYVAARQAAMHYMYYVLNLRQIDIARFFERDHATVIHSLSEVENRIKHEERFREEGYDRFIQSIHALKC